MSLLTKLLLRCCCAAPPDPSCSCNITGVEVLPSTITVSLDGGIEYVPTTTCVSTQCAGYIDVNASFKFVTHPPTTGTWELTEESCGRYSYTADGEFTLNRYSGTSSCSGAAGAITAYKFSVLLDRFAGKHVFWMELIRAGGWHSHRVTSLLFRNEMTASINEGCYVFPAPAETCGGEHTPKNLHQTYNICCGGKKHLARNGGMVAEIVVS
jgi:hypothetical protein